MKKFFLFLSIILGVTMFFSAIKPTSLIHAQTQVSSGTVASFQDIVSKLQEQIRMLQTQLGELRTEVRSQEQELAAVKLELKITRSLRRGEEGEEVKALQEFLKQFPDIYPEGRVTGFFGELTERAVKKYQEKHGLEQVGVVGPKTREKINSAVPSLSPVSFSAGCPGSGDRPCYERVIGKESKVLEQAGGENAFKACINNSAHTARGEGIMQTARCGAEVFSYCFEGQSDIQLRRFMGECKVSTFTPQPSMPSQPLPEQTPLPVVVPEHVPAMTEQVTCVFKGSPTVQECVSSASYGGSFACKGTNSCVTDVKGYKGEKLTWKSSCGGYAYTTVDGSNEYAEFNCGTQIPLPESYVAEQVTCLFRGSTTVQSCYTTIGDSVPACRGVENCVVDVKGNAGMEVTWKSTCGGYDFTKMDGQNEYATFDCGSTVTQSPSVTPTSGYPGFYIKTDKQSYAINEIVMLTMGRADGSTEPHAVDLYATRKSDASHSLIASNIQVGQNVAKKIQLNAWSLFTQGGSGEYGFTICRAGCKFGYDSDTNGTFFNIVSAEVEQKSDLTIFDIYNDTGKLSVKVGNSGVVSAPNTGHLYIWIDGTLKWTYSFSTLYDQTFLSPGGVSIIQPQVLYDAHKIKAIIDPNNVIAESDESNNTLEGTVIFPAQAATVPSLSLSSSPASAIGTPTNTVLGWFKGTRLAPAVPGSVYNHSFYFKYATAVTPGQSFRVYLKRPGESSFEAVSTFKVTTSIPATGCTDTLTFSTLSAENWKIECINYPYWRVFSPGNSPSFYPIGVYSAYVVAVDEAGLEGPASPIITNTLLPQSKIISPVGLQATTAPTITWTVPTFTGTNAVYYASVFTANSFVWVGSAMVSPGNSQYSLKYSGPALDPAKTYYINLWGEMPGYQFTMDEDTMPAFSVSSPSTTASTSVSYTDPRIKNLATISVIFDTLSSLLDKLKTLLP